MQISLKTFFPAAAGLFALTSCNAVDDRAKNYMQETNHTQKELNAITENSYDDVEKQSMLDSAAYRDIFNSTQAAKDSSKIADFNKIAAGMRAKDRKSGDYWSRFYDINDKLVNAGITIKDFDRIDETDTNCLVDPDDVRTARRQHYADDWAYRTFFKKIGIYKDSIAKKCDEISEKIRP